MDSWLNIVIFKWASSEARIKCVKGENKWFDGWVKCLVIYNWTSNFSIKQLLNCGEKVYLNNLFQDIDHFEITEEYDAVSLDIIRNVIKERNWRTINCFEKEVGFIDIM